MYLTEGKTRCFVTLFPTMEASCPLSTASVTLSSSLGRTTSSMRTEHTLVSTSNPISSCSNNRKNCPTGFPVRKDYSDVQDSSNHIGSIWKKAYGVEGQFSWQNSAVCGICSITSALTVGSESSNLLGLSKPTMQPLSSQQPSLRASSKLHTIICLFSLVAYLSSLRSSLSISYHETKSRGQCASSSRCSWGSKRLAVLCSPITMDGHKLPLTSQTSILAGDSLTISTAAAMTCSAWSLEIPPNSSVKVGISFFQIPADVDNLTSCQSHMVLVATRMVNPSQVFNLLWPYPSVDSLSMPTMVL